MFLFRWISSLKRSPAPPTFLQHSSRPPPASHVPQVISLCVYTLYIPFQFSFMWKANFSAIFQFLYAAALSNESLSTSNFYHKYLLRWGIYVACFLLNMKIVYCCVSECACLRHSSIPPSAQKESIQFLMKCIFSLIASSTSEMDRDRLKSSKRRIFPWYITKM